MNRAMRSLVKGGGGDLNVECQSVRSSLRPSARISAALSRHWRGHRAFIDVRYLMEEVGRTELELWLPRMLRRVRDSSVDAIPLATASDLTGRTATAFANSLGAGPLKLGIVVAAGEMIGPEFAHSLSAALRNVGLAPEHCAVIADFSGDDFSEPRVVAPIIAAALEQLQDFGAWRHIIFQGTHYPERNPAERGSHDIWPRNEWLAWQQAVRFAPSTAMYMMFGDYAADSAKMNFRKSRAAAIRHYRYATNVAWLVQRGEQVGSDSEIMRAVCQKIVASDHFAGPGFSAADAFIYQTASGLDGPGNSTTWRQVNTTHHITRVIADLGKVRGVAIAGPSVNPTSQLKLL